MTTRKPTTADELLRELESNPDWVARRDERERAREELAQACADDERDLVSEIRALGYDADSVWDLVNNAPHPVLKRRFIGPYLRAYPTLVRHLAIPHAVRVREGIVRALTVRDGGSLVENALLSEFERETSAELRWVIANALHTAMPYHRRRRYPEIRSVLKGSPVQ